MKIVKAELEDELHSSFKAWCASHGTTMQRRVVDLIEANNGCPKPTAAIGHTRESVVPHEGKLDKFHVEPPVEDMKNGQ